MTAEFDPFDDDNEFSRSWWEGLIAHAPSPEWTNRFRAWRIADLLMERYYADVGLQPIFDWEAKDGPGVHLASPACLQAPRYFGYCNGDGVATDHDLARRFNLYLDGVQVVPVCDPEPEPFDDAEERIPGYYRFELDEHIYHEELYRFGLDCYEVEIGHEGCPHRDGLSPAHLMFRLAVLARLYRWSEVDFDRGLIASLPSEDSRKHELTAQVVLKTGYDGYSWLSDVDGSDPQVPGAPWAYVVYLDSQLGIRVFRGDGIIEGGAHCDSRNLAVDWLMCDSPSQLLRSWVFV